MAKSNGTPDDMSEKQPYISRKCKHMLSMLLFTSISAASLSLCLILSINPELIHWQENDIVTIHGATFGFAVTAFVFGMLAVEPWFAWLQKPDTTGEVDEEATTTNWHAMSPADTLRALDLSMPLDKYMKEGLRGGTDVEARRSRFGKNELPAPQSKNVFRYFFKEIHETQQMLLLLVAVMYAFVGEFDEAAMAIIVICLMAIAESVTEYRAKKAVSSLGRSAPTAAKVIRDKQDVIIQKHEVVVGDLLVLSAGNEVPADVRLLTCFDCHINESLITGEVVPVVKQAEGTMDEATPLSDRLNMAYSGSFVERGSGLGVVTAVGIHSNVGKLLIKVKEAKQKTPKTALQKELQKIASYLTIVAICLSVLGGLLGLLKGATWPQIILAGLALMFATIPEELPMLVAAVLAVGAGVLARKQVFVRNLRVMEALGAVDVLVTDKTGTLTQNKLRVSDMLEAVVDASEQRGSSMLQLPETDASLVNETTEHFALTPVLAWFLSASPLLQQSLRQDLSPQQADTFDKAVLASVQPEVMKSVLNVCKAIKVVSVEPFSSALKRSSVALSLNGKQFICYRGAPDLLLQQCKQAACVNNGNIYVSDLQNHRIARYIEQSASVGKRMLAFAFQNGDSKDAPMAFAGVIAFEDPLQASVVEAVRTCKESDIAVVMCTGDHVNTALCVGAEAGLIDTETGVGVIDDEAHNAAAVDCSKHSNNEEIIAQAVKDDCRVFARATPNDKMALVAAYHAAGFTVAVTADGANDAGALASSDVGFAVRDAVDVARDAAHIVMTDVNFIAIIDAVKEGRRLMDNLFHALCYYLGVKTALVCVFLVGTAWKGYLLQPVQIIVLEMLMDLNASTSFVVETADNDILHRPPTKPAAFNRVMNIRIAAGAVSMIGACLGSYAFAITTGMSLKEANSVAFYAWMVAHFLLAFMFRTAQRPLLKQKSLIGNRLMLLWGVAVILLALLFTYVSVLGNAVGVVSIGVKAWAMILVICFVSTWWLEAVRWIFECAHAIKHATFRRVKMAGRATYSATVMTTPLLPEHTQRVSLQSASTDSLV